MKDGKHVILCVDDDHDVLEQLRLVLEANNYVPVLADSAASGLKACKTEAPDLLIVDLMMEELDTGINLVGELRALGTTTPIFMLSSIGDHLSGQVNPRELGVQGVFQKPIDPAALLSTLKSALGR